MSDDLGEGTLGQGYPWPYTMKLTGSTKISSTRDLVRNYVHHIYHIVGRD